LWVTLKKGLHEQELRAIFEVDKTMLRFRVSLPYHQVSAHSPRGTYLFAYQDAPCKSGFGLHDIGGFLYKNTGISETKSSFKTRPQLVGIHGNFKTAQTCRHHLVVFFELTIRHRPRNF